MADTSRPEPSSRAQSIQEIRAIGEAEDRAAAERGHAAWEAGDPANDEDFELELAAAGIVLDPIRYDRTSSAPPLDAIVAREITEARTHAEQAVRATHAKRPVQSKRAIVRLEPADVEILVHQRQHQAVRDTAKELGVEPEVYYRRTPDSIANCTVHCRDEWPELGDAVYSKPGDERLYSVDETYLAEPARTAEPAELSPILEDYGYVDYLGQPSELGDPLELEEPFELQELPADLQHELHLRTPVEPLAADDPAVEQIKAAALSADAAVRAPEAVRANDGVHLQPASEGEHAVVDNVAAKVEKSSLLWSGSDAPSEVESLKINTPEATGDFDESSASAPLEFEDLPPEFSREELWSTLTSAQSLQIKKSALRAEEAVRAPEAVAAFEAERVEELGPDARGRHELDTTHERAHRAWHQAIRDECADLGVWPGAYFNSDAEEAAYCDVDCMTAWPEIATVATEVWAWNAYLTSDWDNDAAAEVVEGPEAAAQAAAGHRDVGQWLESVLNEAPPVSDLGEPAELEELPPDLEHELHLRTPVEPLAADDPAVEQIKAAALSADAAVRAPEAVRAYAAQLAEELGPDLRLWDRLDTSPKRGHEAWHQTIRSTCADLGVDPGAYFATEPDEVAKCNVDCAETWPEITTVAVVEYPWDIDLTMRCDLETETQAQAQAAATEASAQGRDDQADWLRLNEHTLDEDPHASGLDSGLGCGS